MPSSRNLQPTKGVLNSDGATRHESNALQTDEHPVVDTEKQELNRRVAALEQRLDDRLKEENVQIKELQDKVKKLEEQLSQHAIQIKQLEGLEGATSKQSAANTVVSTCDEENTSHHANEPMQSEMKSDAEVPNASASNAENQREDKKQSEISTTANNSTVPKPVTHTACQFRPGASIIQMSTTENTLQGRRNLGHTGGSADNMFARWMDSSEDGRSLWSNKKHCNALLSYIGKIFGQKNNIKRVVEPLRVEVRKGNELDTLYTVIKELEQQPGAKDSLREWQSDSRPGHRLVEIKSMFEFNSARSLNLADLILTPPNLEEIINRNRIKAYFDLICRDGAMTAEIGEYLHLNKKDIFGGDDYDSTNDRVTFINTDLEESKINLDDNRVDLVTCMVTLHHVPHLYSMLRELVRILRPNGYLILREHDCENKHSLTAKYLNFVHAFMMIARVGEFARSTINSPNHQQGRSSGIIDSNGSNWQRQKSAILEYTKSIQYRTHTQWKQELQDVGFHLKATLDYDTKGGSNPQELFYAVYQLEAE